MDEQQRATSEILRSVFAASPVAITATDLAGLVTLWNPAAERLFGWVESEVLGKPNPTVPTAKAEERLALREQAALGETLTDIETQRLRRDGSLIDVNLAMAATYDASGVARGVTVFVQDLTERKKLEAQFLQAQKMEAVGRLAGGVAHDFNNLLTVILSYCELLLGTIPAGDGSHEDLVEIRKAARAATDLSRQLLSFSRQSVIQPRVIELNAVAETSVSLLKRLIGEGFRIEKRLDALTGRVKADTGQIEQVIMNLAVNARDAMPKGGTIVIETRRAHPAELGPDDMARAPHGYCLISLSDTGTGMDAATQARMFDPFFTTKSADKGTGLGLATVYGIVKQYEGLIRVRTALGAGTTMSIYLPAVEAPGAAPAAAPAVTGEYARGVETILLVEDEPAVRAVARRILEKVGYVVLEAPNAHTALRIAETHTGEIHLLLTDVVMPGIDGLDLAERFLRLRPDTKVLFVSGYSENAGALRAAIAAGHAFIQKPFTPETLAQSVRQRFT